MPYVELGIELIEFDIWYSSQQAIKTQALPYFIIKHTIEDGKSGQLKATTPSRDLNSLRTIEDQEHQ